jgi:photoactive yellow protein
MERIQFEGADISGVMDRLPDSERNRLPFGVVKLDTNGVILEYNMAEAEISGVRQQDVIGKNFFLDVAVCTQRPEFYGKFRDSMDNQKVLNLIFDYEFQNALYAAVHEPIKVRVHMFSSYELGGKKIVWLMVKRVGGNQPRPQVVDVASRSAAPTYTQPQPQQQSMYVPQPAPVAQPLPAMSLPQQLPPGFFGGPQTPQQPHVPQQPQMPPMPPAFMPNEFANTQMPQMYGQQQSAPATQPAQLTAFAQRQGQHETNGVDILIRFDDV